MVALVLVQIWPVMADTELGWWASLVDLTNKKISFSENVYDSFDDICSSILSCWTLSPLRFFPISCGYGLWHWSSACRAGFIFSANYTKQWVVSTQSTHVGTNALTQTGAVSQMLCMSKLPNSHGHWTFYWKQFSFFWRAHLKCWDVQWYSPRYFLDSLSDTKESNAALKQWWWFHFW